MKSKEELLAIAMKLAKKVINDVEEHEEFHFGESVDELDEKDNNGDYLQLELEGDVTVVEYYDSGTKYAPQSYDYDIETDGVKARVTDMDGNVIVPPFDVL